MTTFNETLQLSRVFLRSIAGFVSSPCPSKTNLTSMTLDSDDLALVRSLLEDRSRWSDPEITLTFAAEFARWMGSEHCFAFRSCREALSAAIRAIDLKPGDEVILPGYTCVAVPNAFRFAGINVVFSDIELGTYGLDASLVEPRIGPKTRAIVFQHLYGLVSRDTEALVHLAKQNGLWLIEDCAHAAGAEFRGTKVGNFGDVAVFSSEQSKILNTNQGGVATTNNPLIARRLGECWRESPELSEDITEQQLLNVLLNYDQCKHPQRRWRAEMAEIRFGRHRILSTTPEEMLGIRPQNYGCRMTAPIAQLGLNQLRKIDGYNQQRRNRAHYWKEWCDRRKYPTPSILEGSTPVFLRYPTLVPPEMKQDPSWAERELNIELGVWFVSHVHPASWQVVGCPKADEAVRSCVNFPTLIA